MSRKSRAGLRILSGFAAAVMMGAALPLSSFAAGFTGWRTANGKSYWYEDDVLQGTEGRGKEIYDPASNAWYWLDSIQGGAKAVSKDVYQDSNGGKWVRYDENGRMIKGEDFRYGGWYYFDLITGAMTKGFVYLPAENKWVHYDEITGQMDHGEACINGSWYKFDEVSGAMFKGFTYIPQGEKWVYYDQITGIMAHGEDYIDGHWYLFDSVTGKMIKGWTQTTDGRILYYDPITGIMAHGNVNIDGETYHFDDATGVYAYTYGVGTAHHLRTEVRSYMAASGASTGNPTVTQTAPLLSAPYSAGSLTTKSLQDALAMVNQIRYIAGLSSNIKLNDTYNKRAQAGCLVNAVNGVMTHEPSQPAGMSSTLYQLGYYGTSHSNIASANWNFNLSDLLISAWMGDSDSYNIDRLGHRRWLLFPDMTETGFGSVTNGSYTHTAVYVIGDDLTTLQTSISGVTWPASEMPASYFSASDAWSYSYGTELTGNVSVELTRQTPGSERTWRFSSAGSNGAFYVNNAGYGQPGCVIFRPDGVGGYSNGDSFLVTIRQDDTLLAKYTVHFFT